MTKPDETRIIVTAMISAQVLHETLDELRDTPYYKQKLKYVTNHFQVEITKTCNTTIDNMYKADEATMNILQEGIHEIAAKLATLDPDRMSELRECIKNI